MNNEANYHPTDWIQKKVDDVVDVIRGASWKHGEISKDGVAVLTIPNIQDGRINYSTDVHLKKHISSEKRLKKGDTVAVASSGSVKNIGRSALVDQDLNSGYTVASFLLIMRSRGEIDNSYLYYLSKSDSLNLSNYGRRAADGKFNFQVNEFRNAVLALPSKYEQLKIAFILSKFEQAIKWHNKIIEKTKELKRSLMHRLFTYGLRGEELKEREIGLMPESWGVESIVNVVEKTKMTDPTKNPSLSFKYIDVSGISNESFRIVEYKTYKGSDAPSRARKNINKEDVIFATVRPTLKRIAYIDDVFNGEISSTAFCVLRSKKDILSSKYVYYYVQRDEFIEELAKLQRGASYPAITDSDVKRQKIAIPKIDEQKEIANILSNIDRKLFQVEAKKQILQSLFKSMLNNLMTGQVRVKDIDFGNYL